MNTKKTAFGITGAAAATLLTLGLAAPAMATTPDGRSSSYSSNSSSNSQVSKSYEETITRVTEILNGNSSYSPVVVSPSVDVGDVASGNTVGSGNAIASGNSTPVLSGNQTAVAPSTANGTSVLNGSGNGNSATNAQGNGNSSDVSTSTGQIGDNVSNTINGIFGGLGLSSH